MSQHFGAEEEIDYSPSPHYSTKWIGLWCVLRCFWRQIGLCAHIARHSGCFWISQLKIHEDNYLMHDLELAGEIHALKSWWHYLCGEKFKFFFNDKNLRYIFTQRDLNMRQRRWLEYLADMTSPCNTIMARRMSWLMHWVGRRTLYALVLWSEEIQPCRSIMEWSMTRFSCVVFLVWS